MSPQVHPTERTWERFVAIGDSYTEGMVDAHPTLEDTYVGWADRLAARLAHEATVESRPFGYANLAIRGRQIDDVVGRQLEDALALTPDLVSLCAGGNDILRPKVSQEQVRDMLEEAVVAIRETGADVLLTTGPFIQWQPIVGMINGRLAEFTANVWGIAQKHGAYVNDIWSMRALRDARMWGPDRIHLSSEGHTRIAAKAAWTLGLPNEDFSWATPLPEADPLTRLASVQANREWAMTHLRPWVRRRIEGRSSGDGRSPKRPEVLPFLGED